MTSSNPHIRLVITDIDGVWTDGSMYYDQTGNELKRFHTYDSAGVFFCHEMKIPVAIITGEETNIVKRRSEKLGIDFLIQGSKNKYDDAMRLCETLKISLLNVAFIGDDLNDLRLLAVAGYSACPANAPEYIKRKAKFVTSKRGGEGAFREFVERMLGDDCIGEILANLGK
jgi:3-deoxy-D-manno-octulosonate 8-phosphate phosphatase (KDO 8-P phosphatase)